MIAGVGIDDATAARRHALEAALVKRLQEGEDRTRLTCILSFNQFLASLDLAGGDVILRIGDNERNGDPWLGDAGRFFAQPYLPPPRFNLSKPGLQPTPAGIRRYQHAGWSHDLGNEIARPNEELLDPTVDAGANEGLVEVDLRFS